MAPNDNNSVKKDINVIEINDLESLKRLLLKQDLEAEQYVHWQNGDSLQEAYLRIQNLNGKRTVCHYDIDGRTIILPMRTLVEQTLGVKPIDISGLERVNAGLFNPGGFAADQPIITDKNEKREHARNTLEQISLPLLETMAAKAAASNAASDFAKSKTTSLRFFDKKVKTEVALDSQQQHVPNTPRMGGKGSE